MPSSATVEHLLEFCSACCISNVLATWCFTVFTSLVFVNVCIGFSSFLTFRVVSKQNFLCVWATWMVVPLICLILVATTYIYSPTSSPTKEILHRSEYFITAQAFLNHIRLFCQFCHWFVTFSISSLLKQTKCGERKENRKKKKKGAKERIIRSRNGLIVSNYFN